MPDRHRGYIEQRPNGTYRTVVYVTGRPRPLRAKAPAEKAARVELARLLNQVDEHRHPRADITVDQAIARWLEVAEHVATTRERYDDLIRLYISPTLGSLPLGKVDAELLDRFYARLTRCRQLCEGTSRRGTRARRSRPPRRGRVTSSCAPPSSEPTAGWSYRFGWLPRTRPAGGWRKVARRGQWPVEPFADDASMWPVDQSHTPESAPHCPCGPSGELPPPEPVS